MQYRGLAFAITVLMLPVAAGCAGSRHEQRTSQAPAAPITPVPAPGVLFRSSTDTTPTEELSQWTGHPAVTVTGTVASVDPATGTLRLEDGRTVKLAPESAVSRPGDARRVQAADLRPGDRVVARDVVPVGITAAAKLPAGARLRMATVADVDQASQQIRLADGTAIRVSPSTRIYLGPGGETIVAADLRPGDELVILFPRDGTALEGMRGPASPSALPRQTPPAAEASEVRVFRTP